MKIKAHICVEKVELGGGLHTYRSELHEVEVIRVVRRPATRHPELNRWRYVADIKDHPALSPDAIRTGAYGTYRVNIVRRGLNNTWKPPVFPDGCSTVEISASQSAKDHP